ncbi:hypothetical protein [Actinomadura sp. 9N215]|uniref:hypothetical protein n=1 Tax=Actinomadura sp. 9N215 TaxID=3375150 RepID=UPI0037B5513B
MTTLDDSRLTAPWEPAVQQLLRMQCLQLTGRDVDRHIPAVITTVHALLDLDDHTTGVPDQSRDHRPGPVPAPNALA